MPQGVLGKSELMGGYRNKRWQLIGQPLCDAGDEARGLVHVNVTLLPLEPHPHLDALTLQT